MKRGWLAMLLVTLAVIGFATAGCQGEKPAETPKPEVVTVKFSYPPYGYDSMKEEEFWKKHIAEFEKENPGIKIEQTIESWDNVYTKWEQMLQSGDTADIGYDFPLTVVNYALEGGLLPVTDVVEKLGGEKAFAPAMRYFRSGGEWYGVPHGDASMVLLYRKDILKAAGYEHPPRNWDELLEIARACTKDGVYGLGIFTGDKFYSCQIITAMMKQAGGKMLDTEGRLVLDSPENLKALQFLYDLVNVYKVVPPSAVSWDHGDPANALGTGKVAMCITWGGFGTLLEGMFPEEYKNIGYATQPVGPGGTSGSWSGTGGFFIFKNAKHPEEAKKFVEFMCRPELSKEWALISGNVSPFVAIANDPELTRLEWYRAMQEQSATQLHLGWDYGIIPGCFMADVP
ncbi:MAG: sugar ABC transporter substrate-binding protein, partial [Syntrophomonadaceae bacterium]|nr:sugar ABC transporter substrate-binding protein [Syntrophomonadaceae bacterium]